MIPQPPMIAPARSTAFEVLADVELAGGFSDALLASSAVDALEPRDRRLVTEIVYGTLRWQGWLDALLATVSARPWSAVDPKLRIILRMTLYQMWRMDRIPDRAAVHDAVEIARRAVGRGSEGFANGVLRRLGRERPWEGEGFERLLPVHARVSLPAWLWSRWETRFGAAEAERWALSLNQPPRRTLRLPSPDAPAEPLAARIERSTIAPTAAFVDELEDAADLPGAAFQDEASQLVAHLFGPISGMRAWDACAAPGGKSAIVRGLLGPAGRLVASDRQWRRVERLRRIAGAVDWGLVVADAAKAPPFRVEFDAVLTDVPCSGLGTVRRNPEIKWRFEEIELERLAEMQGRILEEASSAVARGGLLLYSTCSTEPEENERVVERFLERHPAFRVETPRYPPGIEAWTDSRGLVRTFPAARLWDGFFAALMVRNA